MRSPLKIPCATPAWGAWSLWTMSHPSHFCAARWEKPLLFAVNLSCDHGCVCATRCVSLVAQQVRTHRAVRCFVPDRTHTRCFFSDLVVNADFSCRYSDLSILTASWCSCGPFHLLLHQLEIMSKTGPVICTLTIALGSNASFCPA